MAARSNGSSPRSSWTNAAKATSRSSEDPSARAARLVASCMSIRRPSSSRNRSASMARSRAARAWPRSISTRRPTMPPSASAISHRSTIESTSAGVPNSDSRNRSTMAMSGNVSAAVTMPPTQAEEERRLEHDEVGQCAKRLTRIPRIDEQQRADEGEVGGDVQHREPPTAALPRPRQHEEREGDERLHGDQPPGGGLVTGREVAPVQQQHRERHGHEGDADDAQSPDQLHAGLRSLGSHRCAPLVDSLERPHGVLAEQRIVAVGIPLHRRALGGAADVARRDERVPAQPARIVPGDVEAVVPLDQVVPVRLEPVHERDRWLGRLAEVARWRGASRRRGSRGRRPGRCRSRRRAGRARRGTAPARMRAPASSRTDSGSSRACRARRARRSGTRRCRACTSRNRRPSGPTTRPPGR